MMYSFSDEPGIARALNKLLRSCSVKVAISATEKLKSVKRRKKKKKRKNTNVNINLGQRMSYNGLPHQTHLILPKKGCAMEGFN